MRAEIDAHEALAERLRLPSYAWWAPMWRATLAILEGRYADAEAVVERLAADSDPNARLYAEIQTYMLHWNRDRFELMDTGPIERESGRPAEYAYRAGYSWMLAMQGRGDEAREHLDWIASDDFARLGDDMNTLAALCEMAQAITALQDRRTPPACSSGWPRTPTATSRTPAARPATARPRTTWPSSKRCSGSTPAPRFEEALRRNTELGSRPWAQRTLDARAAQRRQDLEP